MSVFSRVSFGDEVGHWVCLDGDGMHVFDGAPFEKGRVVRVARPEEAREHLAPVVPKKIVCVGRNFGAHAKELGHEAPKEPLIFLKPPSSIIAAGTSIELPRQAQRVDHEAELGVVIGKRARDVSEVDALSHVFGYTVVNDVTARDLQKSDGQWSRAKGFDTFCPVGPVIVTDLDPTTLRVRCLVNGETRQDDVTSSMLFSVAAVIAYVSAAMTLEPGDLIAMGTPAGVSPLSPGDLVEVVIDGIGSLANPVVARG